MNIKVLKPFVIRDSSTGELTSYECGQVYEVDSTLGNQLITDGLAELYSAIVPYGIKNITANGTYDVIQYATANVAVDPSLSVVVTAVADDVELFGKDAGDLQEEIAIANGEITGTLNYVTGYTGFSSKTAEQSGNYLAIKVEALTGSTITVELINGTLGHPVTLDEDGMIVIRITNTSTQSIRVVATKGTVSETLNFSIADLVLAEEQA